MLKFVWFVPLILLLGAACSPTAAPTPIIIVITATPGVSVAAPTATRAAPTATTTDTDGTDATDAFETTPAETPSATGTVDPNLKATTVKYVRAKQDINIRKGPGTKFDIVGGVYFGNTAEVKGFKSADDQWWQVECPVTTVTVCWVSADSTLTEPTDTPYFGPTPTGTTGGTTEANAETFTREVAAALRDKDYDALKAMMDDPFTLASWRSEGTEPTREQALKYFQENWVGPAKEVVVDIAGQTNQTKLLDGTSPLTMWDPKVKTVKSVYVEGLNADGKGAGLLVIAQRPDGAFYLYAFLYAAAGFTA